MVRITIALWLVATAVTASADCMYNGTLYPAGVIINGLTCQTDGSWK